MVTSSLREGSFVIFGLGTFGEQTARALYRGGAVVLAVDRDSAVVDAISPFVTSAVCVDATDEEALNEVGAFDMTTAIVALKHRFDTTVLVTHMLRQRGYKEVLVQVDTEKEASAIRAVGATDVVFPERDMADQIARKLLNPGLADQIPLGENIAIIDVPCPQEFIGKTLMELEIRRRYGVTVVALKDLAAAGKDRERRFQVAPAADQPLQPNHHLLLMGERRNLFRFKEAHDLA